MRMHLAILGIVSNVPQISVLVSKTFNGRKNIVSVLKAMNISVVNNKVREVPLSTLSSQEVVFPS